MTWGDDLDRQQEEVAGRKREIDQRQKAIDDESARRRETVEKARSIFEQAQDCLTRWKSEGDLLPANVEIRPVDRDAPEKLGVGVETFGGDRLSLEIHATQGGGIIRTSHTWPGYAEGFGDPSSFSAFSEEWLRERVEEFRHRADNRQRSGL